MKRKTVLVTGSSIGLGSAIIEKYASNNYNVVITYNNNKDEALKLNEKIKKYNVDSLVVKCDISNENDIENMKNAIINKFEKLDILINNASISNDTLVSDKTKENFMRILEVNLVGTFLLFFKVWSSILLNMSFRFCSSVFTILSIFLSIFSIFYHHLF